jgi:hypothetical protein
MATETPEWTVPTPVRALMWWPPIAFVLVAISPGTEVLTVTLTGLALAVLGSAAALLRRWVDERNRRRSAFSSTSVDAPEQLRSVIDDQVTAAEPASPAPAARAA